MKSNTNLILCDQNLEDMPNNKDIIRNNIRTLQANLNLAQDDLARKSSAKYTTLSKIESDLVTNPTVYAIAKISKALDIYIDDLVK